MDPIAVQHGQVNSTPSNNSPGTPYVTSALSTIIFVSVIAIFMMLGLYFTFTRRRSISDARLHLIHQLRDHLPSILLHRPANVSLPIRNYTKEEMGGDEAIEDYPVCLVEFEEGEEVKVVAPGCEHVFHLVCIDRWLVMRNTCPVCRSIVTSEEMYRVEEWGEVDAERLVVTEETDDDEGEEEELVVNVANVVISGEESEGEGGEVEEGEVVVNVESLVVNGEGGEGEGEVVVNVESIVLNEKMIGGEVEKVNLKRNKEEGEVSVIVQSVGVTEERNGFEGAERELEVDTMSVV